MSKINDYENIEYFISLGQNFHPIIFSKFKHFEKLKSYSIILWLYMGPNYFERYYIQQIAQKILLHKLTISQLIF